MLVSDAVAPLAEDRLAFSRYVDPLVAILTRCETVTPLTIGVFGTWGSGKSTLLGMVDARLAAEHREGFVRVHFNPWIHRGESNLLLPLLYALQAALEQDPARRFQETAKRVLSIAGRLAGDMILGRISSGSVSLDRVDELQRRYADERGRVDSELRQLRETLQAEADKIAERGARMVIFIDDLDRCQPAEIIDVLESVKLFLDLRNVFVLLAVDKEVIDRGIEVKYGTFTFADDRRATLGAEYLEKMVQLPLHLHPLRPSSVAGFIRALDPSPHLELHLDLLERIAAPNPRKIKRILNILAFTRALIDRTPELSGLDNALVVRLVVLQVQHGELYAAASHQLALLRALESVYVGDRDLSDSTRFSNFGAPREVLFKLTKRFYNANDERLGAVFAGAPFSADGVAERLPTYLSMLSG